MSVSGCFPARRRFSIGIPDVSGRNSGCLPPEPRPAEPPGTIPTSCHFRIGFPIWQVRIPIHLSVSLSLPLKDCFHCVLSSPLPLFLSFFCPFLLFAASLFFFLLFFCTCAGFICFYIDCFSSWFGFILWFVWCFLCPLICGVVVVLFWCCVH